MLSQNFLSPGQFPVQKLRGLRSSVSHHLVYPFLSSARVYRQRLCRNHDHPGVLLSQSQLLPRVQLENANAVIEQTRALLVIAGVERSVIVHPPVKNIMYMAVLIRK